MRKGLVLGFFDGIHKAHRVVIESALNKADEVAVITFDISPAEYFGNEPEYILPREESAKKIRSIGNINVIKYNFSDIVSMSADEYLHKLVETFHPKIISTGFNHTFGKQKSGNTDFLKQNEQKYNYKYICTPPIYENGEVISSTLIKNYLKNGQVEKANSLLESAFLLEGIVIKGNQIGRTIGFPTANLNYPQNIVKIPYGVYKVQVHSNDFTKPAIMNWGIKPTINNGQKPVAEVHIPNFNSDLYNKKLKIEVLKQIRSEKKFESIDELKAQIKKDTEECLK